MSHELTVETRLVMSKRLPPTSSSVSLGRYKIRGIPSIRPEQGEVLLEFVDTYEAPLGGGSHPEEEANILSSFLSVIFEARVRRVGLQISGIDFPAGQQDQTYQRYLGQVDPTNADEYLRQVFRLPIDLARQVARACRACASAIEFIPSDPTFAFFLLVVAVECLSSQAEIIPAAELDLDARKCDRFCTFIERYWPEGEKQEDDRDPALVRELLKTVHFAHRSAFVHGGKEVSAASLMADRVGSSYFKHATEGKEVKTPGLGWFARVVRGAILGYLGSVPREAGEANESLLAQLAHEKAVLRIKAKRDLKAGDAVMTSDIEYR